MKVATPNQRRSTRGGAHLFTSWPRVARRIRAARHIWLFLDFDGTLTPIRRRPEDVPPLDLPTRRLLRRLSNDQRLDVFVISGRRLADLKSRIRAPGVRLLGLYGWEERGIPPLHAERKLVRGARRLLRERLAGFPEIRLEDKRLAVAVHYRGAKSSEVRAAFRIVRQVLERFQPQLRLIRERKAWELLHCAVGDKGSAVRRLLGERRQPGLAICVGDDASDESAFAALPRGITVQVGNTRRTQAHYYLRNPGEVVAFLRRMEAEIS